MANRSFTAGSSNAVKTSEIVDETALPSCANKDRPKKLPPVRIVWSVFAVTLPGR